MKPPFNCVFHLNSFLKSVIVFLRNKQKTQTQSTRLLIILLEENAMKRNVFRPFLFVAILVLTVGMACGIDFGTPKPDAPAAQPVIEPSPQPIQPVLPTAIPPTAVPPTATLEPTPTPPPAPQALSEMLEILERVAQGNGVPEAAAYDKNESEIHPIVIIAPSDEVDEWNKRIPDSWRPLSVSQTELVAVVTNTEVTLETKQYCASGGGYKAQALTTSGDRVWVSSIRIDTEIVIREAKTGILVSTINFKGNAPPALPNFFSSRPSTVFYGTSVAYEIAILGLADFVEP